MLLAAAVLLATATGPVTLWQNALFGDSEAEVRSKFSGLSIPAKPDHLGDGAECKLRIDRYEVLGRRFGVCFFFKQGKLEQVTLSQEPPSRGYQAELDFDSALEALRSKYGAEDHLDRKKDMLTVFQADWYRDRMNVNLLMVRVGENDDATLNINYQARVAADADKL